MQQTLGIVPFYAKGQVLANIAELSLEIIFERKFELSVDLARQILKKELKEPLVVYGFILEGQDAIKDWLNSVQSNSLFLHASITLENAQNEMKWFEKGIKSLSSSTSTTSSIPVMIKGTKTTVTKKVVSGQVRRDTSEPRKPSTTVVRSKIPNVKPTTKPTKASAATTTTITKTTRSRPLTTATFKKLDTNEKTSTKTTTPTKQTPLVGHIKKTSKLMETKPVSGTTSTLKSKKEASGITKKEKATSKGVDNQVKETKCVDHQEVKPVEVLEETSVTIEVKEEEKSNILEEKSTVVEDAVEEEKEIVSKLDSYVIRKEEDEAIVIVDQDNTIPEDDITLPQQPISHPSTTSSSADEHDAEVAAATSNKSPHSVKVAANFFQQSGRSSSFSPNSLPRPETPEVDQLRQRFETIIQTSAPSMTHDIHQLQRRPSSKEFISRIKELKPKDPVGSKVKSMVNLFMDENLNKWEF